MGILIGWIGAEERGAVDQLNTISDLDASRPRRADGWIVQSIARSVHLDERITRQPVPSMMNRP